MIRTVARKASRRTSMTATTSGLRHVGGGTSTSAGGCPRQGVACSLPRHRGVTAAAVRSSSSLMSTGGNSFADRCAEKSSVAMASSACASAALLPTCHRRFLVSLTSPAVRSPGRHEEEQLQLLKSRRYMGMYRRPHQRNLREDPSLGTDVDFDDANPALSADDMETYDFLSGGADFHPLDDDDDAFGRSRSEGDGDGDGVDGAEDEERIRQDLEEERKAQAIRDELDQRTGRGWTDDWTITDEDWFAGRKLDDLPDWSPEICSRMSLERVKVVDGGVPTLSALSSLPLPPSQTPHPASGNPKPYTKHARRSIQNEIQTAVEATAANRVTQIMTLSTWEEKQDAVDELFESVEEELRISDKGRMSVLSAQPKFGDWVEAALERYLKDVAAKTGDREDGSETSESSPDDVDSLPTATQDANATPVFMDVLESGEDGSQGSPRLVSPLQSHHKEGTGRMVEEWDLAANKATKRIMVRQCVRDIAQTLEEAGKEGSGNVVRRVYVNGKAGVGKTAALAAIVASARKSGQIVLYLPDGDRFRKLGKYIRPNNHREGDLYDLPVLAMEVCDHFLGSHADDLEGMSIDAKEATQYLTADELRKMPYGEGEGGGDSIPLVDLLKAGSESTSLSSGCYAAVVHSLMNQTEKPFVAVVDGFNCYFDYGQYFHEAYDPDVNKAIPFQKITLLKPLLEAMGVEKSETRKGLCRAVEARPMKRGAIVVGTTETHSVARLFTDTLSETMEAQQGDAGVKVVEVLPFSPVEVEHIVANFEITGVGRLRFDRGSTVMNDQEVAYLRLVSGGNGQNLIDACII